MALHHQTRGESVRTKEAVAVAMIGAHDATFSTSLAYHGAERTHGQQCRAFAANRCTAVLPSEKADDATGADAEELDICRRIVRRVMVGAVNDPTGGANAYHTIFECPVWAANADPIAEFGSFLFYRVPR